MTATYKEIEKQKDLMQELRTIHSLVEVCAKAIKDTGTGEDDSAIDVLLMASNRLWELSEQKNTEIKALEIALEGGE